MAHFAKLDENNIVVAVHVIHNNELFLDGNESEDKGVLFLKHLHGENTRWKQTSYNGNIRKNYAGIGYTYDAQRNAFIPPQPFASWLFDENTCRWYAPVTRPIDNKMYTWDEATTNWVEVNNV